MPRTKFIINDQPGSYAVWLGETGQVDRMEAYLRYIGADKPKINNNPAPSCICEQMYQSGSTHFTFKKRLASGHTVQVNVDSHVSRNAGGLPADWFKRTYDAFAFGQSFSDPGCDEQDKYWDENRGRWLPAPVVAVALKNWIEEACPATYHYPRLSLDAELGRDVYVSSDAEKRYEAIDQMESDWFDASHPWVVYGRRENRGADAGASNSDVLQRQRDSAHRDVPTKASTLRLSADVVQAESTAERKTFNKLHHEEGSAALPFLRLVWAHKRRIRAKEEQARRDIRTLLRRLGKYDNPEALAWVQASVAKRGYVATRDRIWKSKADRLVRVGGEAA